MESISHGKFVISQGNISEFLFHKVLGTLYKAMYIYRCYSIRIRSSYKLEDSETLDKLKYFNNQ